MQCACHDCSFLHKATFTLRLFSARLVTVTAKSRLPFCRLFIEAFYYVTHDCDWTIPIAYIGWLTQLTAIGNRKFTSHSHLSCTKKSQCKCTFTHRGNLLSYVNLNQILIIITLSRLISHQIYRKTIITIKTWCDLTRLRIDLSVCNHRNSWMVFFAPNSSYARIEPGGRIEVCDYRMSSVSATLLRYIHCYITSKGFPDHGSITQNYHIFMVDFAISLKRISSRVPYFATSLKPKVNLA